MPFCQSFRKLERTPIEKKVRVKKMTRKTLASPIAGVSLARVSGEAVSARARPTRNVTTNPMMNFGKRIDMIGPNVGEDESPDTDENIDEDLDRRGRSKEPADLIVHAFRGRLREDKGLRDTTGSHGGAVRFH